MTIVRKTILITALFLPALVSAQAQKPAAPPAKTQAPPKPAAPKAAPAAAAAEDEVEIPPDVPGSLFPAVVARVNSRPILGRDAERRIQAQLAPIGNPEWKNLKEDYQQELIVQALGSLIAAELVYQKALSSGMKATEAEVGTEFAKVIKSFGSDAEMNVALAGRGLDRQSYTKELARSMTIEKFIRETIGKKIVVTPAEVAQYYADHKVEFRHPDVIRTSHILFMVPEGATPEQDRIALQRAEGVLARVKKGEDFAKLAKENSMDASASNGGDIGMVPRGDLNPDYEKAAYALPVGGVSQPVRTTLGYHIIKVTEKKKEGIAELEEVRPSLTEFLRNQRIDAEVEKVVAALRTTAKIEVLMQLPAGLNFGKTTFSNPRP